MALKKTPGWGQGDQAPKTVKPALAHGKPNAPTPFFKPVSTLGAPKAGVKQPFDRG